MSIRTVVVFLYYPRCGIYCVHLEACKEDKSPGADAMIVRSLTTEEPMWGCNDSEIIANNRLVREE
jgi:hypothetical protein